MKFWVGVTDNEWFKYLSEAKPDEVNFWQPGGTPPFTGASMGLPFLFKLKRPYNHIAGGGFYVTYSRMPLDLAWEVFGQKNGCNLLDELSQLISPLKADGRNDGEIGCTVLANPFFFDETEWLLTPEYVDIFGVPFSLIPFKGREPGGSAPPDDRPKHEVMALPERKAFEIRSPVVERYIVSLKRNLVTADNDLYYGCF